MSVQKIINANAYKNNSGTVVAGGAVDTTGPITKVLNGDVFIVGGGGNPGVVAGTGLGVSGIISSGDFAELNQFIMLGGNVTTELCGIASDTLQAGMSDTATRESLNAITSVRTTPITAFDIFTGTVTKGSPTNDSFGADHVATSSKAIPGEFCYFGNGITITNDDYEARNG